MRSRCLLFAPILTCCGAILCAQTDVPGQSAVPVFKANSQAVVVDVVVTKGNDEPVLGLRKEDFHVTEDGKPQPVDLFEEHSPANIPSATLATLPQMPPHVFTNVPSVPPGDSVNVLLLDSLNTPKEDQVYVQQQITAYLKAVQPGTRIAIFTLGMKLRFVQGFTGDPSVLRAVLNDKKNGAQPDTTPASRTHQDDLDDRREIWIKEQMLGNHRDAGIDATEQSQADFAAYQSDQRVSMTLEALRHLALYLAGVPGRKNLIWFSSTFPVTVFPSAKQKQLANVQREYIRAARATADLLTLSKVAIYPVGAEGVVMDHPLEASNDLVDAGAKDVLLQNIKEGSDTRAANMEAMEQLASDTGGEAIFNSNDLNKAVACHQ